MVQFDFRTSNFFRKKHACWEIKQTVRDNYKLDTSDYVIKINFDVAFIISQMVVNIIPITRDSDGSIVLCLSTIKVGEALALKNAVG